MRDLDLIRSYRSDVDTDDDARAAARATVRDHIAASEARGRRPSKPTRRVGLVVAIVLGVTSAAAAAGVMLSSDDVSLGSVACLDAPSTLANAGSAVFVEPSGDPVAACARLWRAGDVGDARDGTPELVACASAGDPIVVVPGGARTCATLGLEPLPGDVAAAGQALGRAKAILQRDWDLNRPASRCEQPQAVLDHARGLLESAGVRDVRVALAGGGPCAGPPDFSSGGALVRIPTVARDEAADSYEFRLIGAALEPLDARSDCEDPQQAAARARQLLVDAGLAHVRVAVAAQGGPCFDPGGFELSHHRVTLSTRPEIEAQQDALPTD
jgi:hypothetical protein